MKAQQMAEGKTELEAANAKLAALEKSEPAKSEQAEEPVEPETDAPAEEPKKATSSKKKNK